MATEDLIREAQDPTTSAARLAELVQADPATWSVVASHPAAYPGLLQWLGERGDAATNAALAARASAPTPTEILPTTPPPVAEAPVAAVTPDEPTVVVPATEPVEPVQPVQPVEQTTPIEAVAPAAPHVPDEPTYTAPVATADGPSKRNFWVLAGMVAVVLVLIGGIAFGATKVFGGDDSKDDATPTKTSAPTSTPSDDPTADAPTSDAPGTDEPSSNGGDNSDFCAAMAGIQDVSLDAIPSDGGTPDAEDLKGMVSKMTSAYAALSAAAPAELKDEIEIMSSFLKVLADPTGAGAKDFTDNMDKYTEAVTKVSTYYAQNCS